MFSMANWTRFGKVKMYYINALITMRLFVKISPVLLGHDFLLSSRPSGDRAINPPRAKIVQTTTKTRAIYAVTSSKIFKTSNMASKLLNQTQG